MQLIKSIEIKNFFHIKDHNIKINLLPVTIMFGLNGCGKSTILRMLDNIFYFNFNYILQYCDSVVIYYGKHHSIIIDSTTTRQNIPLYLKNFFKSLKLKISFVSPENFFYRVMYYQTIVTDVEKTLSQIYNDEKSINFFNTYCSKIWKKVENGYTLSLGEHYLLYLIQKVLTKPNILLIDTPESFLHIDLQIDLINNIKSFMNNSQLIVTTHSPEIMAEIDDENIYRINYIDNT